MVNFPKKYNIYNVGYGNSYDLREVVKKISSPEIRKLQFNLRAWKMKY